MKSQKTLIALLLVVAILALGVAYAAITAQQLTVEGSVETATSDANFDVKFSGDPTTAGEGTTVATLDETDSTGRKAIMNVSGLTTKDQSATATFTILNNSPQDVVAALTTAVTYDNTEWFDVKVDLGKASLARTETTTATVTVTLKKTPVTADDLAEAVDNFVITINAAAE